jgi:excisionase family DNA binding protein
MTHDTTHDNQHDTDIEGEAPPRSFVVTITDAHKLTGLSVRTIQRRLDAGTLEALEVAGKRCVRLSESDLSPGVPHDSIEVIPMESGLMSRGVSHDVSAPLSSPNSSLARVASDATGSESGLQLRLLEALEAIAANGDRGATLGEKLLLTVAEAAVYGGVGKSAIEGAIKSGEIKAHSGLGRGRRVKRADVEKWAAKL